jgi:hypothetical protein
LISVVLRKLNEKSYILISPNSQIGYFTDPIKQKKVLKKGAIVRQGDIVKLGRVPMKILKSSFDLGRL